LSLDWTNHLDCERSKMIALVDVGWIWHPCIRKKGWWWWSLNSANHFDCKRFKANIRNSRAEISPIHIRTKLPIVDENTAPCRHLVGLTEAPVDENRAPVGFNEFPVLDEKCFFLWMWNSPAQPRVPTY